MMKAVAVSQGTPNIRRSEDIGAVEAETLGECW
jgi:hypothetical protein